ncbi:M48 family metalloprotease [Stieleria sp. JC731]|uniref:M48 family metallopeptidase n=1 Tax=Pirellulaceae TaxID=2691357 RepID=UPI001E5E8F5D|nr:M48 family metalloprotease [Stieleria sp. JC731]MCC9601400.1 M48 family metalloprotease [Stieleria sp. JC731]
MDPNLIPDRADLLAILRRANQNAWLWISIRFVAIAALIYFINWKAVVVSPIASVIACLVAIGPFFMDFARIWGQSKKRVEDIKESTRFGELDKHKLKFLFQETLRRLHLAANGPRLYVTNDRSLNASSLRLTSFFTGINGIYLNRQTLHKLNGQEVQSVMGHELGHYYKFKLVDDHLTFLTITLGALVGLFAVQEIRLTGLLGFIVLSAICSFFWMINNIRHSKYGRTIEYLCDDFGAQVNGIEPSVSSLLKIGLDAEIRGLVYLEVLGRNLEQPDLSPKDIATAIEAAVPFGFQTEADFYESVAKEVQAKRRSNRQLSLKGFFKYVWESDTLDDEEDVRDQLEQMAKYVNQLQRIEWEEILDDPNEIRLSPSQIDQLAEMILQAPGKVLFRVPELHGEGDSIHPPIEDRILYLWKNRNHPAPLSL